MADHPVVVRKRLQWAWSEEDDIAATEAVGQLGDQEEPFLPEAVRFRKERAIAMKSRMNREVHVRIRESLGVKFPGATRPLGAARLDFRNRLPC